MGLKQIILSDIPSQKKQNTTLCSLSYVDFSFNFLILYVKLGAPVEAR